MFDWFKKLDKEDSKFADKEDSKFEVDPETGFSKSMQVTIGYHPRTKRYFITLINKNNGSHLTAMMTLDMFVDFRNSLTNCMMRFEGGLDIA